MRVLLGIVAVFFCWTCFSVGQALAANNGLSLAGKPQFSLTAPKSKLSYKHVHGFKADIPANLTPFARPVLPGEGTWRLVESVHGEPAVFATFMRVDAVHTSYVAGIASFDQRLVKFQLHPGSQDPGTGFGGGQPWIPPGDRTGLLATFNGGFRLSASRGGFYFNGATSGTLTSGAASVVYYRNGTIRIGQWGRDVTMSPEVMGVRQNLKLIVDHGKVAPDINQDVEANFGATLGGTYVVWRSGLGITRDGRVIYVYGPALSAQSLADLLLRAGAVEAMELDINPFWTTFEYYQSRGHPVDPAPVVLLPDRQTPAYRYYSPYSRDFNAVYAR